jgi:hypothetical protein
MGTGSIGFRGADGDWRGRRGRELGRQDELSQFIIALYQTSPRWLRLTLRGSPISHTSSAWSTSD